MSMSHTMLDAAGPQAATIEGVWWLFFWVSAIVWILVVGAALWGVLRRRRGGDVDGPGASRRAGLIVGGATGVTLVLLFVLFISSVTAGRRLQGLSDPGHVPIKVTGQQWWWTVEYESDVPSERLVTANEIHIPIGRPIQLKLRSLDVNHSFYVPSLHGTKDLIPGHEITTWLQADRPGIYRGQCDEFCGHQHAHMAFLVVAKPPAEFAAWLEEQRRPAAEPETAEEQRGRDRLLAGPCVMCHTIRGTAAGGRTGPDLTHVGSRLTLAAGTLPNTAGHMAGWITDSQRIKPGNRMPTMALPAEDLQAIVKYLRRLK